MPAGRFVFEEELRDGPSCRRHRRCPGRDHGRRGRPDIARNVSAPGHTTAAGEGFLRIEAWKEAAKSFQQAIDIDPQFEDAYYGLGRAQMAQRQFTEAIASYSKCRDLYRAEGGRRFTNQQEARRHWQDRMMEVDDVLRQYQQGTNPQQTTQTSQRIRHLQELRRDLQERLTRSLSVSIDSKAPAFVSLALGSAYFRSSQAGRRRAGVQGRHRRRSEDPEKRTATWPSSISRPGAWLTRSDRSRPPRRRGSRCIRS